MGTGLPSPALAPPALQPMATRWDSGQLVAGGQDVDLAVGGPRTVRPGRGRQGTQARGSRRATPARGLQLQTTW